MSQVTAAGYQRTRLDEYLAQLDTELRAIFGPDINLDPDTVDGQTIGIMAEIYDTLDQAIANVYNGMSPSAASGAALSRLVQLNGILRLGATRSTVDVTFSGTNGTVIPGGTVVQSTSTKAKFELPAAIVIGVSGSSVATCEAQDLGAVSAPANTITKIVTPVYGLASVNNTTSAVVGRNMETDAELRARRTKSVATPSQSLFDSVYAAIANLEGVTQVLITENDTGAVDVNGLPGHSMFACVQGGAVQDIGEAIYNTKSLGVTMVGTVETTVNDTLGQPHTIKFSRPTEVPIYVIVNVTTLSGWPTTGAQDIKDAIVEWALANQYISDDVIYSRLYEPINSVPGHSVTGLFVGTAPAPTGTIDIPISFAQLATFTQANIVVNVT